MSSLKTSAGIGLIAGAGGGYRYAKQEGYNPWTGKPKYQFRLNVTDGDLQLYDVAYDKKKFLIGGEITKENKVLTIKNFDIDGSSTNQLGVRGVREFANDFGQYMKVDEVHIIGAQRTTGANPGKISTYKHVVK